MFNGVGNYFGRVLDRFVRSSGAYRELIDRNTALERIVDERDSELKSLYLEVESQRQRNDDLLKEIKILDTKYRKLQIDFNYVTRDVRSNMAGTLASFIGLVDERRINLDEEVRARATSLSKRLGVTEDALRNLHANYAQSVVLGVVEYLAESGDDLPFVIRSSGEIVYASDRVVEDYGVGEDELVACFEGVEKSLAESGEAEGRVGNSSVKLSRYEIGDLGAFIDFAYFTDGRKSRVSFARSRINLVIGVIKRNLDFIGRKAGNLGET